MLDPQQNQIRNLLDLSGVWDFQTDPHNQGEAGGWALGLPQPRPMTLPGSRDEPAADLAGYPGPAWYLRRFTLPAGWNGQRIFARVRPAQAATAVWVNGQPLGGQAGDPSFDCELTDQVNGVGLNTLAIRIENVQGAARVSTGGRSDGSQAGSPVILFSLPQISIQDISVKTQIEGSHGIIQWEVRQTGASGRGRVKLSGNGQAYEAALIFSGGAARGIISVENVRPWSAHDPFLYEASLTLLGPDGSEVDRYHLPVGVRSGQASPDALLNTGSGLERPLTPAPDGPAALADPILRALTSIARRLDGKHPGMNQSVAFHLEGEGIYRLVIENGSCRAEAGDGRSDAAITLKPEDALKLVGGDLNPMAAVMTGRVKISGDLKTLAVLQGL